jgi:hypothetical protein
VNAHRTVWVNSTVRLSIAGAIAIIRVSWSMREQPSNSLALRAAVLLIWVPGVSFFVPGCSSGWVGPG